jgi:hypothetical protein
VRQKHAVDVWKQISVMQQQLQQQYVSDHVHSILDPIHDSGVRMLGISESLLNNNNNKKSIAVFQASSYSHVSNNNKR